MGLKFIKKWFGNNDSEAKDTVSESAKITDAVDEKPNEPVEPVEPVEKVTYDVTPPPEAKPEKRVVPPPPKVAKPKNIAVKKADDESVVVEKRTGTKPPAPMASPKKSPVAGKEKEEKVGSVPKTKGPDAKSSQTFRVQAPGTNASPDIVIEESKSSLKVSQTVRVESPEKKEAPPLAQNQNVTVKPPSFSVSPAASKKAEKNNSQTFRIEAPGSSPAASPSIEESGDNDARRSQTFRVGAPQAPPAPEEDRQDDARQSQTFRVGAPQAPPASPVVSEEDKQDDARQSQTFRIEPPKPLVSVTAKDAGENGHSSQTFRVDTPVTPSDIPELEEEPVEDLDRSQTFRIAASPDGSIEEQAPEPPEKEPEPPEGTIGLPAAAVLAAIPEDCRGGGFDLDAQEGKSLYLQRETLLAGLRVGRLAFPTEELAKCLPDGCLATSEPEVELVLGEIVRVAPPELLAVDDELTEDAKEIDGMDDFFSAKIAAIAPDDAGEATGAEEEAVDKTSVMPAATGDKDGMAIPLSLILCAIPPDRRGPGWVPSIEGAISLKASLILDQLATGRVILLPEFFVADLPPSSLVGDDEIELPLAELVAIVPSERLAVTAEADEEVKELEAAPGIFNLQGLQTDAKVADVRVAQQAETVAKDESSASEAPPKKAPAAKKSPVEPEAPKVEEDDSVAIPLRSFLTNLPKTARGPKWDIDAVPDKKILLDCEALLEQLRDGLVEVDASDLYDVAPDGWIAEGATGRVVLELADVVAAIPPERLTTATEAVEGIEAKDAGLTIFHPEFDALEESAAAPSFEESSVTSSSVAEEEVPAERQIRAIEREWDGVEVSLEYAPLGVDLNLATVVELMSLKGVGENRAQTIIDYRNENGPFESIFDLAEVPGVGPSLFRRMTGFSINARHSRHLTFLSSLGLEEVDLDSAPLLLQVSRALAKIIGADGCVLTNQSGIPLGKAGIMAEAGSEGDRYAALGARYFIRSHSHLRRFVAQDADCLIIPGCTPTLLLLGAGDLVAIMALHSTNVSSKKLNSARRAMREAAWLTSRRAVIIRY